MADEPAYPELVPPPGWILHRVGTQRRYLQPGAEPRTARLVIVVSPLLPRSERLPAPRPMIEQTLAAERARHPLEVLALDDPAPIADVVLPAVEVRARVRTPAGVERRAYVLVVEPGWYQAVSYLAPEDQFEAHLATFLAMVRTIRPAPPPDPSPFAHYGD